MNFGLIGTITYDEITFESGQRISGLGGVLYQASVLCSLGKDVFLYTNLGEELVEDVTKIVQKWSTLRKKGLRRVPGPGNRVHLHYPEKGERVEVLKSVVPPLDPAPINEDLHELGMLILVINSGYDLELSHWRDIVESASFPIWIDVHSLFLSKELNVPRQYLPMGEWEEWVKGVSFLQANIKEVASMLGTPEEVPSETELSRFGEKAFELGVEAVFVTLGKEGVLVLKPGQSLKIAALQAETVVDKTGCGDVFCGGAAVKLALGKDPFDAARFGLELATQVVEVKGVEETFRLVKEYRKTEK
ncbi:MAG: carbohydrate kinase family protein [Candidatus Aminicenantes bacterium]|jgi:sugar/nucleoside kinase (ribokinase family)